MISSSLHRDDFSKRGLSSMGVQTKLPFDVNGATVWLLPNDNEPGRVRMAAVSPGGLSVLGDDAWKSARVADTIAGSSGLGAFNQIDLGRRLAGVSASRTERIAGSVRTSPPARRVEPKATSLA